MYTHITKLLLSFKKHKYFEVNISAYCNITKKCIVMKKQSVLKTCT